MWTEEELIRQTKSGQKDAFDTLVGQSAKQIYSLSFRLTGNSVDAEDLWQNAFISAYRNISKFKYRAEGSFSAWVYRIVVNLWKDTLKHKNSHTSIKFVSFEKELEDGEFTKELVVQENDVLLELEQSQNKEFIQKILDNIAPNVKIMLILRDIEGKSYKEIAELMDCPLGTVKWRIAYARELFRQKYIEFAKDKKNGL